MPSREQFEAHFKTSEKPYDFAKNRRTKVYLNRDTRHLFKGWQASREVLDGVIKIAGFDNNHQRATWLIGDIDNDGKKFSEVLEKL